MNELRKVKSSIGLFEEADGSAYLEMGNTKVLAVVYGPREPRFKSKLLHDKAIINCEFSQATFSTGERRKKSKGDKFVFMFFFFFFGIDLVLGPCGYSDEAGFNLWWNQKVGEDLRCSECGQYFSLRYHPRKAELESQGGHH